MKKQEGSCGSPNYSERSRTVATASLETRVKALESGGGANCPECGWDGKTPLKHIVSWVKDGPDQNTYCGTCGRPICITVTWGDEAWPLRP
jgi:hypothetical protein